MLKELVFKINWRFHNKDNYTTAENIFAWKNVHVGKCTYGGVHAIQYNMDAELYIGNYCSIAENVVFLLGGEHDYHRITSWPFNSRIYQLRGEGTSNYSIYVEDDVWIGYGTTILSGVKIGKGSIIGAKSIVTKDVPPYSIFVGNNVIKKRFSDEIINKLLKLDFGKIHHEKGDKYQQYVFTSVNESNVDQIIKAFK